MHFCAIYFQLFSIFSSAGFRIVFAVFKEDSAAASNVMQLGYNFGGIIGPTIMSQFIDGRVSERLAYGKPNNTRVDNFTTSTSAPANIPLEKKLII